MNETFNLDFINALTKVLSNYIDQQVDKKVGEVLASHESLKQIDESFEKRILELTKESMLEAIDEHCANEDHKDDDDIESVVSDHDFSDQVYEAVNDAINDHDFEDAIKASLADYDFSDHIRDALNAMQIKISIE
jgi:hypothetical protein